MTDSRPILEIDREIFARFPAILVGAIEARGIDNRTSRPELVEDLRRAERAVAERLGAEPIVSHERIAPWREAYRLFGAKPKKHRSSIEALVRRAVAGEEIPSINPLVDLYNRVSLDHLLPAGGEDLETLVGTVRLRFAGKDEAAVTLLGDPEPRPPEPGEVIYADDVGAVCRRWNWREAARTRLTPETRDAILVIEALPPAGLPALRAALDDLAAAVEERLGGRTAISVLAAGG